MSLPGLDLTQPSGEKEFVPAPPTQITVGKGSEWRFEVAFGTVVRVKVSTAFSRGSTALMLDGFLFDPQLTPQQLTD